MRNKVRVNEGRTYTGCREKERQVDEELHLVKRKPCVKRQTSLGSRALSESLGKPQPPQGFSLFLQVGLLKPQPFPRMGKTRPSFRWVEFFSRNNSLRHQRVNVPPSLGKRKKIDWASSSHNSVHLSPSSDERGRMILSER